MAMSDDEFSSEGINKKVNEEILNHSMTLYPGAAGALAMLWGGLFSNPAGLIIGGVGLGASVGFGVYQKLAKTKKISQKYIEKAREDQKQQLIAKLDSLGPELRELDCEQGALQVNQLSIKFQGLQVIINEKLEKQPVQASRLNALAEKLYLATIDNLLHAKQILKSVQNIDLAYIDTQLAKAHNESERESLMERKKLKMASLHEITNNVRIDQWEAS